MVMVQDAFHWCAGGIKTHCPNTFFYLMDYINNLKKYIKSEKNPKSLLSFKDLTPTASSLEGYVFS